MNLKYFLGIFSGLVGIFALFIAIQNYMATRSVSFLYYFLGIIGIAVAIQLIKSARLKK